MAFNAATFADFFRLTTAKTLTGPETFVNEVLRQDHLWSILARGQDMARTIQGGTAIQDFVMLNAGSTRQRYSPDGEVSYPSRQVMTPWQIPFAFTVVSVSITDHEIRKQIPSGMSTDGAMAVYKRLQSMYYAAAWTECIEGTENDCLAVPDTTKMEATPNTSPQEPYSIFAFVNEFPSGLYPSYAPGGAWTTKAGISPATFPAWDNYRDTYTNNINTLASGLDYDLFRALDRAILKTRFRPAPLGKDVGEYRSRGTGVIATSLVGVTNYMSGLRHAEQSFTGTDAGRPEPSHLGANIMYVPGFETAPVFRNAANTALVTESDATCLGMGQAGVTAAPRYIGLQGAYMAPVWDSERYFDMRPAFSPEKQFWRKIIPIDTWANLAPRSLRHQFCVAPGGTIV